MNGGLQPAVCIRNRKLVAGLLLGGVVLLAVAGWYVLHSRTSAQSRFQSGLLAFEAKNLRVVAAIAAELDRRPQFVAEASLLKGMADYLSSRYPQAVMSLETARNSPHTSLEAWRLTGQAYHAGGRATDAIQALNQCLQLDAADVESLRLLAILLYDLGAMDPCLEHLDRLAQLEPEDARPLRLKGLINKDYDFFQEAAEDYREALRRGLPNDIADEVRLELAECLLAVRDYAGVRSTLLECHASSRRQRLQGECAWAEGDIDTARRLAEEVLQSDPGDKFALSLATKIAVHEQNVESARHHGEALLQAAPHDPETYLRLSQVYRLAGDGDRAAAMIERQGQASDRLAQLRKLHEDALGDVSNAQLRYRIGELSLEIGKPEMARTWFEACLAIDPAHARAKSALGRLHEGTAMQPP